jgi:hypothetical protein
LLTLSLWRDVLRAFSPYLTRSLHAALSCDRGFAARGWPFPSGWPPLPLTDQLPNLQMVTTIVSLSVSDTNDPGEFSDFASRNEDRIVRQSARMPESLAAIGQAQRDELDGAWKLPDEAQEGALGQDK